MSVLEAVKQNKINKQKAEQFDALQRKKRESDLFNAGANEAYSTVERELARRYQTSYAPSAPMANPSISDGLAGWSNGISGTNLRRDELRREIETKTPNRGL